MKHYQKDFDEKNKVYRNNPKHDWSSHCADMMRYWAVTDVMDNSKLDKERQKQFAITRMNLASNDNV